MESFTVRTFSRSLCLFVILLLSGSTFNIQSRPSEDLRKANELWEQAIAAKGGREQLYKVESLVVSYQDTVRNFLGIAVHRGVVERLYVFPGKSWGWDDGLPPPFRLTVGWLDLERNRHCHVYKSAAVHVCRSANQGVSRPAEGINQVQYLYLMETRWVKPIPVSVTKGEIGFKKVDVLHTRFEDKLIDYFLDRKTHLPARVAVFYSSGDRPTFKFDFSEYQPVNGLQMPGKQEKGRISLQINPPYDNDIFTRPPSIEAGPEAWQGSIK
jgi:hypothetical protein